jgi:phosphoglycolate phosphatase
MKRHGRRAVVFDFDGTVADTAPLMRTIYAEQAKKFGWTPLTDEAYADLRKGTLRDARRWAGIHWWQLPWVVKGAKRLLNLEADQVKIFPGMIGLIRELEKDPDIDLYILSRNTKETVAAVLERKNLSNELTILGRRRLLGSKSVTLNWLVASQGYRRRDIVMVGDEIRDVRAAKRAGTKSIAVTWGLQDEGILRKYRPTYLVTSVDELRDCLYSL